MDGDGVADFVVGFNGGGGVRRLDTTGKPRWQKPDANVWHVEIVDTDGDGKPEIVHTNASGQFTIRDQNGTVIRRFASELYCADFSLCVWPTQKSSPKLLVADEGRLCMVDFAGGITGRYQLPPSKRQSGARGALVRLKKDEQEYLAAVMVGGHPLWASSVLCLFNPERQLVYREEIPGKCDSIIAVPEGSSGLDELLVGGTNTVWKYTAANYGASPSGKQSDSKFAGTHASQVRDDNSLKMTLVWCPPGKFTMGSPTNEEGRYDNETQVQVTLTKGFWLGQTEVTQSQWQRVMHTTPWNGKEEVKEGGNYPATFVSWDDAMRFCEELTKTERRAGRMPAGWKYTLPTEVQWEYACRTGTKTRFSFGDDASKLTDYGWFGGVGGGNAEDEEYAHPVGQKKPNPWGLYDMHGNVEEWCRDNFVRDVPGGRDPELSAGGSYRVFRSGSWVHRYRQCRSAARNGFEPNWKFSDQGFRLAAVQSDM